MAQKLMSFSNNFVGHRINQRFGGFFPTGFVFGFDLVSVYDKTGNYNDRFKIQIANIGSEGNIRSFPVWNWTNNKYVNTNSREIKQTDSPFMGSDVAIGSRNIALTNNQNSGVAILDNNGSLVYVISEGNELFAQQEIDISNLNSSYIYYVTVWMGVNYSLSGDPTQTDNIKINWYIDDLTQAPVLINLSSMLNDYFDILSGVTNPLVPVAFSGYSYLTDRDNYYRGYLNIIDKLRNTSLLKLQQAQNYVEEDGEKYYLTPVGSLVIPVQTGSYPSPNANMFITRVPEYYDYQYFDDTYSRNIKYLDERSQIALKKINPAGLSVEDYALSRVISIDYGIRSNANIMNLIALLQSEILSLKVDNLTVLTKLKLMESDVMNNKLYITDLKKQEK